MPEYFTPGVYMEEFEIGARPIEGVSTSTAGFLGLTERGPTKPPKLVTSLAQFMRIYGGYIKESYLAYAVDAFFQNGGQRCFIGRIVRKTAKVSTKTKDPLTFTAVGKGSWGDRVGIRIIKGTSDPDDENETGKKVFNLTVAYWKDKPSDLDLTKPSEEKVNQAYTELIENAYVEDFVDLSEDPNSPDYYMKKLGDPLNNLSNLVYVIESTDGPERPQLTDGKKFFELLKDGKDTEESGLPTLTRDDFRGEIDAKPGEKTGLTAFTDIDEISILYVPDIHKVKDDEQQALAGDILTHCETLKDRFAILDVPPNKNDVGGLKITDLARPSKYGAMYYPWIKTNDPLTKTQEMKPPGGYIAGIYARSDTERGVHKAPANELVRGAIGLEFNITKGEQGTLNPRGINVIRNFPGRGIRVWGARTTIMDPLWKYINVRRLFIYVEESIEENTQWVVFEPNNNKLWARVRATITQFLTRVWRDGALMGTKAEEAFFVKCDRSIMTQDDIDNGRLKCVIGIAPVKPAEFVIFRIAQWAGGSSTTE